MFVEKGRVPDRVERLGEVDRSENRQRARLGLVKPIRNKLSKMKSRPSRAKTGLAGRENGVGFQKEK